MVVLVGWCVFGVSDWLWLVCRAKKADYKLKGFGHSEWQDRKNIPKANFPLPTITHDSALILPFCTLKGIREA